MIKDKRTFLSALTTLIGALIVLWTLVGCTNRYPITIGSIKTNDIPTLRAFQRECLKGSHRFVRIEQTDLLIEGKQWHMTCYENPDYDVLEGFNE